jgi:hypothetical protein
MTEHVERLSLEMGQITGQATWFVTVPHIRGEDTYKSDQAAGNFFGGLSYFEEERTCAAGLLATGSKAHGVSPIRSAADRTRDNRAELPPKYAE